MYVTLFAIDQFGMNLKFYPQIQSFYWKMKPKNNVNGTRNSAVSTKLPTKWTANHSKALGVLSIFCIFHTVKPKIPLFCGGHQQINQQMQSEYTNIARKPQNLLRECISRAMLVTYLQRIHYYGHLQCNVISNSLNIQQGDIERYPHSFSHPYSREFHVQYDNTLLF